MARRVTLRERLIEVARATVGALAGAPLVETALASRAPGPTRVWAIGKAAASMAEGAARALGADLAGGILITKNGAAGGAPAQLSVHEAAHPVPDARGAIATRALLAEARSLRPDERVLLLLSGGTSALLCLPILGLGLDDLAEATRALVLGGATIAEINAVRRRLGAALGGRLALATRARIEALALSDVVGDDPATIGSGPVSPDPTTREVAEAVAARYHLPASVRQSLCSRAGETPSASDPAFSRVRFSLLASPASLRNRAAEALREAGLRVRPLSSLVTGDVESLMRELLDAAPAPGEVLVAAGEPTVKVHGAGQGGRAQHLALSMSRAIRGSDLAFVAFGSDGSDGPTPSAGAAVDGASWEAARAASEIDPEEALRHFDSHPLLSRAGLTLETGPTGTNLTDLFLLGRAGGGVG